MKRSWLWFKSNIEIAVEIWTEFSPCQAYPASRLDEPISQLPWATPASGTILKSSELLKRVVRRASQNRRTRWHGRWR